MNELFPFTGGLLAALIISRLSRRRNRLLWCLIAGSLVGVAATVASGEYHFGWSFLLLDAALASCTALGVSAVESGQPFRRRPMPDKGDLTFFSGGRKLPSMPD